VHLRTQTAAQSAAATKGLTGLTIPPQNWPPSRPNLPAKPRRIRGGEKLSSAGTAAAGWAGQRWLRLMEQAADGAAVVEGLEYAKLGQTRRLSIDPGRVEASVQGREFRAYTTMLRVKTFDHAEWQRVIDSMADQAIYAAKLLAGELPQNIEDVFVPLGMKLFPGDPSEIEISCTCGPARVWCKHVCCVTSLLADRLGRDPFLMFVLRGLSGEEMLERLRQRRTVAGAGTGSVAVYAPRVPGVSDEVSEPLESVLEHFWEAGPQMAELDLPIERPVVSHPLLRRLGPSPFQTANAKFPLVGLLATCYELASEAVIKSVEEGPRLALAESDLTPSQEPPSDSPSTPDE